MALQVWLPLNGNSLNYGALTLTPTTLGSITWNASGKIGKCLQAGDGTQIVNGLSYNTNLVSELGTEFSACVWVKPLGTHVHYNGTILSSGDWNNSCWAFGVSQDNTSVDVFSNGYNCYISCSVPVDTWTHLACVHKADGTTQLYKNGTYVGLLSRGTTLTSDASNFCVGRETYASGYFSFNGLINDVRIYDECLSEKLIKEISKGLILHYPLNDFYCTPYLNMAQNPLYNNRTEGTAYTPSSWGGSAGTITYYHSGGYNNYPYKVIHTSTQGTGGIYLLDNGTFTLVSGKTYTYSAYIKTSANVSLSTYSFNINGVCSASSNQYIITGTSWNFTTEWLRYSHTFTIDDSLAGTYNEMSILYTNAADLYICGFLIEEGSVATPYKILSLMSSDVPDTSGFQYDGSITGTILTDSSSPRNNLCYRFDNSATSIGIGDLSTLVPDGLFTYNIWFKKVTDEWSTKGYETILGGPSGFELEMKSSSTNSPKIVLYNWGSGSYAYTLDTWHMLTFTRNSSETKIYLDGVNVLTGTAGTIPSGSYFIGAWKSATQQNYRGYLSDARLYATVLSADDINVLYKSPIEVTNNGGLMTQGEVIEV